MDTREPAALQMTLASYGFPVTTTALSSGDFLWVSRDSRSLCVERKTVSDFLSSISDKQENGRSRLVNQMMRMRESWDEPILLLEGELKATETLRVIADGRHTKWSWDTVENTLLSIQRTGILVTRCHKGAVPERIESLQKYFERKRHLLPIKEGSNDGRGRQLSDELRTRMDSEGDEATTLVVLQ